MGEEFDKLSASDQSVVLTEAYRLLQKECHKNSLASRPQPNRKQIRDFLETVQENIAHSPRNVARLVRRQAEEDKILGGDANRISISIKKRQDIHR